MYDRLFNLETYFESKTSLIMTKGWNQLRLKQINKTYLPTYLWVNFFCSSISAPWKLHAPEFICVYVQTILHTRNIPFLWGCLTSSQGIQSEREREGEREREWPYSTRINNVIHVEHIIKRLVIRIFYTFM